MEIFSLFYFQEANCHSYNELLFLKELHGIRNQIKNNKSTISKYKNANTLGKKDMTIDAVAKSLAKNLTLRESKKEEGITETVKIKDLIFASTGVIGETFPEEQITNRISDLVSKLRDDQNKLIWIKTASAIMTTDTKPKLAYEEFTFNNKIIRIAAIAKGSGMIALILLQCYRSFSRMQIFPLIC